MGQLALSEPWTDQRWNRYARNYRREMAPPAKQRLIALIAALSRAHPLSIGCYCEREERCHRSLLRELLLQKGAKLVAKPKRQEKR
jgi:uncharacterized protein YeaO (DUF488 family)